MLKVPCDIHDPENPGPCKRCLAIASRPQKKGLLAFRECIRTKIRDVNIFQHTLDIDYTSLQSPKLLSLVSKTVDRTEGVSSLSLPDMLSSIFTWMVPGNGKSPERSIVGALICSDQFRELVKDDKFLGGELLEKFRVMVYSSTLAYVYDSGSREVYDADLTMRDLHRITYAMGSDLLLFLDNALVPHQLANLSQEQLSGLFVVIFGIALAVAYSTAVYDSPTFDAGVETGGQTPKTLWQALQQHLSQMLAHHLVILGARLGLVLRGDSGKEILSSLMSGMIHRGNFVWVAQQRPIELPPSQPQLITELPETTENTEELFVLNIPEAEAKLDPTTGSLGVKKLDSYRSTPVSVRSLQTVQNTLRAVVPSDEDDAEGHNARYAQKKVGERKFRKRAPRHNPQESNNGTASTYVTPTNPPSPFEPVTAGLDLNMDLNTDPFGIGWLPWLPDAELESAEQRPPELVFSPPGDYYYAYSCQRQYIRAPAPDSSKLSPVSPASNYPLAPQENTTTAAVSNTSIDIPFARSEWSVQSQEPLPSTLDVQNTGIPSSLQYPTDNRSSANPNANNAISSGTSINQTPRPRFCQEPLSQRKIITTAPYPGSCPAPSVWTSQQGVPPAPRQEPEAPSIWGPQRVSYQEVRQPRATNNRNGNWPEPSVWHFQGQRTRPAPPVPPQTPGNSTTSTDGISSTAPQKPLTSALQRTSDSSSVSSDENPVTMRQGMRSPGEMYHHRSNPRPSAALKAAMNLKRRNGDGDDWTQAPGEFWGAQRPSRRQARKRRDAEAVAEAAVAAQNRDKEQSSSQSDTAPKSQPSELRYPQAPDNEIQDIWGLQFNIPDIWSPNSYWSGGDNSHLGTISAASIGLDAPTTGTDTDGGDGDGLNTKNSGNVNATTSTNNDINIDDDDDPSSLFNNNSYFGPVKKRPVI